MRRFVGLALVAALAAGGCTSSHKPQAARQAPPTALPTVTATATALPSPGATYLAPPGDLPAPGTTVPMSTAEAPWPAPVLVDQGRDSAAYVAAAGLPYAEEMLRVHYHAHLDVIVDGNHVPVPAYLGFVVNGEKLLGLAPLHTHNASGVIHIENAVPAQFVLGQVFTEWGVRFTPDCVGAYCSSSGRELAVFVNGVKYDGDPRRIVLTKHEEIAVEYGDRGALPPAPASYDFPKGL